MGCNEPNSLIVYIPDFLAIDCRTKLIRLANESSLTIVNQLPHDEFNVSFFLTYTSGRLTLFNLKDETFTFHLDYILPKISRRRHMGRQDLARAIGAKDKPLVFDATAGLGYDAILLASHGCSVVAVEQLPALWALCSDALARIQAINPNGPQWSQNVQFLLGNSLELMNSFLPRPDVIYLDPMFLRTKKKHALPKKQIQLLQTLLDSAPHQDHELLDLALKTAKKKVVVKRSTALTNLGNKKPSYSIEGKLIRFDVYLVQYS